MLPSPILAGSGSGQVLAITFSADANNINLKTEIEGLYGTQTLPVVVIATVNAGIKIGSTSTANAAFRTGGFANGSTVILYNNGRLAGCGGNGSSVAGGNAGGPAVYLDDHISINNGTTGEIFGGGGGGGKGANWSKSSYYGLKLVWGGPGGGGQGRNGGSGGAGGVEGSVDGVGDGSYTTAGGNGTESGPGGGGYASGSQAGNGGSGGAWGSDGSSGGQSNTGANGSAGGAGGKAIAKNGKNVAWLGGNNGTQVKGAVS